MRVVNKDPSREYVSDKDDPTSSTPFLRSDCDGQCSNISGLSGAHHHHHNVHPKNRDSPSSRASASPARNTRRRSRSRTRTPRPDFAEPILPVGTTRQKKVSESVNGPVIQLPSTSTPISSEEERQNHVNHLKEKAASTDCMRWARRDSNHLREKDTTVANRRLERQVERWNPDKQRTDRIRYEEEREETWSRELLTEDFHPRDGFCSGCSLPCFLGSLLPLALLILGLLFISGTEEGRRFFYMYIVPVPPESLMHNRSWEMPSSPVPSSGRQPESVTAPPPPPKETIIVEKEKIIYRHPEVSRSDLEKVEWLLSEAEERLMALIRQNQPEQPDLSHLVTREQLLAVVASSMTEREKALVPPAPVDTDRIQALITAAIRKYDQDKTGLPDYALEPAGGSVLSIRCTESYSPKTRRLSLLGIPLWYTNPTPRTVIQPGIVPGECWAFKGYQGFLVLQLSGWVSIDSFSYEHISKAVSPEGHIDSAPKDFEVLALNEENDSQPRSIGNYTFDQEGPSLQFFPVQKDVGTTNIIELKIKRNHGHPQYTCLYRFRVHGRRLYPSYEQHRHRD